MIDNANNKKNTDNIMTRLIAELSDPEGKSFENFFLEFNSYLDDGRISFEQFNLLIQMAKKRERIREIMEAFDLDDEAENADTISIHPEISRVTEEYGVENGTRLLRYYFTYYLASFGLRTLPKNKAKQKKAEEFGLNFHTNLVQKCGVDLNFLSLIDKFWKEEKDNWKLQKELVQCGSDYVVNELLEETDLNISECLETYSRVCDLALESQAKEQLSATNTPETTETKICKNCGKTLPPDSLFCQYCGEEYSVQTKSEDKVTIPASISLTPETTSKEDRNRTKKNRQSQIIAIVLAAVLIASNVAQAIIWSNKLSIHKADFNHEVASLSDELSSVKNN